MKIEEENINNNFVKQWSSVDIFEYEYKSIKNLVQKEIKELNTISKSTFERLINWKSPRTKGKLKLDNYKKYSNKFTIILSLPTDEKLNQISTLEGIGISVASTILHFIYPEEIPIVDFRVIECLQNFSYLDPLKSVSFYRDNLKGYIIYRNEILKLVSQLKVDLRQLDKALFAFHKIKLGSKF